MKKRNLWLITALMTLALLGVFVMQLYYIKESYKLKSQLFEQDVNQVLENVANKIQKKNAIAHITKKDLELKKGKARELSNRTDSIVAFKVRFKDEELRRKEAQRKLVWEYLRYQDSLIASNFITPIIISEEAFQNFTSLKKDTIHYRVNDAVDENGQLVNRQITADLLRKRKTINRDNVPDTIRYVAINPATGTPITISLAGKDAGLEAKFNVEDAKAKRKYELELKRLYADTLDLFNTNNYNLVQDVAKEIENQDVPLERRMPSKRILDTLIKRELLAKNINLKYHYWVTPAKHQDRVIYRNVADVANDAPEGNTFQQAIFSNDMMIKDPGMLTISFPRKNALIFANMTAMLASSAGLLLVLVGIFAYTIYAIIRQKKLSEMKTDFINNMTHEFKTPVATIMIASEALKDPELTEDRSRIARLANIIYDENVRLGNHIERVLSVARLDKKETKLNYAPVNLNELVSAVVDSMNLQLQKKDAVVNLQLDAPHDQMMADELHLSNVIYNLIDNANKYSVGAPQITISTKNVNNKIVVDVSDEGIGMTKEQSKRIFDQFYRVPTGNLHDVKGFGLGLNYVHSIISQMNGQIRVTSEKDRGTTFEITLPLTQLT